MTAEMKDFRQLMIEEFESRKVHNPRYSLRMFSSELNVNPATLSMFFAGKRDFGSKIIKRISENLKLNPTDIERLTKDDRKDESTLLLESRLHFLYADPIYFSLLALVETVDFINDEEWIANRLNTNVSSVQKALATLIELNLIKEKNGKLKSLSANIGSLDNVPNYSLRLRHQKNMDDAKEALSKVEMDKRYFSFETLAFDPEDLPFIQKKINMLLDDLILLSKRSQEKKEVYEFCMLYFPRTK